MRARGTAWPTRTSAWAMSTAVRSGSPASRSVACLRLMTIITRAQCILRSRSGAACASPHVVCVLLGGAQALTFKATEGQPWQGYGKQLPAQQRQALDALHPSNLRQLHAYRAEPADFGQCAPSLYCVRWSYCIARAARSGADPPTAAPAGTAAAVSQAAAPAVRCATARPACRCRSRFRTGRCVAPAARSGPKHRAAERWCNRADAYFRSGGE
jgi:hypothetical protein